MKTFASILLLLSASAFAQEKISVPGLIKVTASLQAAKWDARNDINELELRLSSTSQKVFETSRADVKVGESLSVSTLLNPQSAIGSIRIDAVEYDTDYTYTGFDWFDVIPYAIESASKDVVADNENFDLTLAAHNSQLGLSTTIKRHLSNEGILTITVHPTKNEKLTLDQVIDRAHKICSQLDLRLRQSQLNISERKEMSAKASQLLTIMNKQGAGSIACGGLESRSR